MAEILATVKEVSDAPKWSGAFDHVKFPFALYSAPSYEAWLRRAGMTVSGLCIADACTPSCLLA